MKFFNNVSILISLNLDIFDLRWFLVIIIFPKKYINKKDIFEYTSLSNFRKRKHLNDNDVSETYKFMFHILLKPTTNNNKTTYSYINSILIVSERERERGR